MLLFAAHGAIAANPCASNNVLICDEPYKKGAGVFVDKVALGESGATFFNEIMTHSKLFAHLMALDASTPDVTRSVEYVALFNEAHQINQQLAALLIETKRNNRLLAKVVGAHSGTPTGMLTNNE